MSWLQIILDLDTHVQAVDQIAEELTMIGAVSITLQDAGNQALYEPSSNDMPIWEYTRLTGLFAGDTNISQLQAKLRATITSLPPYQLCRLAEQDWHQVAKADFYPRQFGKHVWVCPSWHAPPDSSAINIFLDPGLAFGTGTHATTALCLEWIAQQNDLQGKVLIDYGCGSGILAITAAKLGAARVWAVDNDPQALIATQDNAKKNSVEKNIQVSLPKQLPLFKVDGLIANILVTPLVKLASTFAAYLKIEAPVVLSGVLKEQTSELVEAYEPYFSLGEIVEQDSWICMVAKKKLEIK